MNKYIDKINYIQYGSGDKNIVLLQGSNTPMENVNTPSESEGADFIIKEAMRTDTKQRLYVCCGGSLNTIASAYLKNPGIAEKLTLIWIGGEENLGEMQIMPQENQKLNTILPSINVQHKLYLIKVD